MEKTEIIVGAWKVKRIDSTNWQVFELREIGKAKPGTKSREGETDWVGLPAYYATLLPALERCKELNRARKLPRSLVLDDVIDAIARLDEKFLKALKKALA